MRVAFVSQPWTKELVRSGETGLLVPPANPKELARAMLTLLLDPERRRRMSEAARTDAVQRYSWERIAESTLDHYRESLACV